MLEVFSYGGGVQSTAALVLAAQHQLPYRTFLFCNVGEDSENPDTLTYFRTIALPYAQQHDLTMIELHRVMRTGERETVYGRLTRPGSRSIGIPVRMSNGAPGNRACTLDFKIRVVARWLKEYGATKDVPATVGLGISLDEWQRMRTDSGIPHERLAYPLIELRLDRAACVQLIRDAGLPVPPKSSCWFCPYHSLATWQAMRQTRPDLFYKAVALEQHVNQKRAQLGRDAVWFSAKCKPLEKVTSSLTQSRLFENEDTEMCESGYCMV